MQTPQEKQQEQVLKGIDAYEDVTLLGRMAATKSIRRNLEWEDDLARRSAEAGERELHGDNWQEAEARKDSDDMDIMVAHGDVHINSPKPAPPAAAKPDQPQPQPPPTTTPPAAGMSKLALAGLLAGAVGLGSIPGLAAAWLLRPRPQDQTDWGLDLLPPAEKK